MSEIESTRLRAPRGGSGSRIAAGVGLAALVLSTLVAVPAHAADPITVYVAPHGDDAADGTSPTAPVQTLPRAQELVREVTPDAESITVALAAGDYYLDETLLFTNADSGADGAPVRWVGSEEGTRIKGGRVLTGSWTPTANDPSVLVTDVPVGIDFDELFIDDVRQVMARYPDYDENAPRLEGTTTLATLNARSAEWADPTTGYVRAMHCRDWGSVSFTIGGREDGELLLDFVGDNNRPQNCNEERPLSANAVMVENVREELDAPFEWFLDRDAGKLYLKPGPGVDLDNAKVEVGELDELVILEGTSAADPLHDITFESIEFGRTHRTLFNSTFEGLSRGDWSVVRKGAMTIRNTRDVSIVDSAFTDLGGNAVFLDGYNEGTEIVTSVFENNGATDVHVVGSPSSVRDYAGNYFTTPDITDLGAGPKTEDYPRDVLIEGNAMSNHGRYEKQTSSVNISIALDVTVRGNTMSNSPRACLNFSDTTWGGHLIQDNDIFDCVNETGDNGSINAWGRSRFWETGARRDAFASLADGVTFMGNTGGELTPEQAREMAKLDTIRPIVIDHNRFWHDGDWAIDLDDGSSQFIMTNNVLLKGGIKLRDGFDRTVTNNLILDGSTFEQVSYMPNGDVIRNNITLGDNPYFNTNNEPALAAYDIDENLFWNAGDPIGMRTKPGVNEQLSADGSTLNTSAQWYAAGMDRNSRVAAPGFTSSDPAGEYDFTVGADSPAVALGYTNIPMTGFGAPGAPLPPPAVLLPDSGGEVPIEVERQRFVEQLWGGQIDNITTRAEQSAYAINDSKGVRFVSVPSDSTAAAAGLEPDDLMRAINGEELSEDRNSFWQVYNALPAGEPITLDVRRGSTDVAISLTKPTAPELLNNTSGVIYRTAEPATAESWLWRDITSGGRGAHLRDIDATQNDGDAWELTFHGTGIDVISQINGDLGDVDIAIDGEPYTTQSFYSPTRMHQQTVLSVSGLPAGVHTITGTKKTGSYMIVDAFLTHPAEDAEPDAERPVATLVAPSESGPFPELDLRVDATDDHGLKRIVANVYQGATLVKSTQSAVADGATAATHTATVRLPDGEYYVKYNAEDLAGNIARTGSFAFTIDATAPTLQVKSGAQFTVGEDPYGLVSFKLFDAGKIDRFEINGVVKDLADNKWSDVNFVAPGKFGAVQGANVMKVVDVAGNVSTVEFTLE
ncbi:PDZ domain-containing protein [Microbacterium koreense]|uniref:PDZ domain-containing protein n=1 Tax=Microbacterium koreense TaxID=323761 RepID=A0ABW2ZP93_9MICO